MIPEGAVYKYALFQEVKGDYAKYSKLTKIVGCESSWNPDALGDHGKALGLFQYHSGTFDSFKKSAGMEELEYGNPMDQITLSVWAFDHGLSSHWTCSRLTRYKVSS